jgi:hypothetical protein
MNKQAGELNKKKWLIPPIELIYIKKIKFNRYISGI